MLTVVLTELFVTSCPISWYTTLQCNPDDVTVVDSSVPYYFGIDVDVSLFINFDKTTALFAMSVSVPLPSIEGTELGNDLPVKTIEMQGNLLMTCH